MRALPVPFWRHGLAPPPRTSTPGLGLVGPGSGSGELGGDHLVQHGHVGLDPEHLGIELDFALAELTVGRRTSDL